MTRHGRVGAAVLFAAFSLLAPGVGLTVVSQAAPAASPSANVTVYATGLNNPRGLKFGPDGNLYVAEGGTGGTASTVGTCTQAPPPIGPYTGSPTGGRISRIAADGTRTTVTDTLPSATSSPSRGFISGVADVAFLGTTMYALVAGAGCSHGVANINNGVVRVNSDGTTTMVADLSAFIQSHAVAQPDAADFEPDGTWYSMIGANGSLYAVEPNHGELDKINPTSGQVSRVADISASQGHIVPTALAYNGNFYVSNLNTFPVAAGSSKILQVTPTGSISTVTGGLNAVVGLVMDAQGQMYALELTSVPGAGPTPNSGQIVRVSTTGKLDVIATGLNFPSGMTMGLDGQLYVSNNGIGAPGSGQVVKVQIPAAGTALPPTVSISPSNSAVLGSALSVTGTNFTPNSMVYLSFRTPDNHLSGTWLQTDAAGNFTSSFTLDQARGLGTQMVQAYDSTSKVWSMAATITVTQATTPLGSPQGPKLSLTANSAFGGKLATLSGTGFPVKSWILLNWTRADGTTDSGVVFANASGSFSVPFTISSTHGCGISNLTATSTDYPPRLLATFSGSVPGC